MTVSHYLNIHPHLMGSQVLTSFFSAHHMVLHSGSFTCTPLVHSFYGDKRCSFLGKETSPESYKPMCSCSGIPISTLFPGKTWVAEIEPACWSHRAAYSLLPLETPAPTCSTFSKLHYCFLPKVSVPTHTTIWNSICSSSLDSTDGNS